MSDLENRIERLEKHTEAVSRCRDVSVLTDDELAVIITGNPDAKASDLTDDELKAAIAEYEAKHPDSDIIHVVSENAKQLTEHILAGERTGES